MNSPFSKSHMTPEEFCCIATACAPDCVSPGSIGARHHVGGLMLLRLWEY